VATCPIYALDILLLFYTTNNKNITVDTPIIIDTNKNEQMSITAILLSILINFVMVLPV
jgi:hypothetical protein